MSKFTEERVHLLTGAALTALILLVALSAAALPAHAGELYGGAGLPGAMLGYAQPVSDSVVVRADIAAMNITRDGRSSGLDYSGTAKLRRAGVYADWFVASTSGFRLTGGVTFNDMRANFTGYGNGTLVTVGNNAYLLTAADRMDVEVEFPAATPYLGLGWGHRAAGTGWGFVLDAGASIGKAKATGRATGPALSTPDAQADFQRELDSWSRNARFVPQLSLGVSYVF